jgi:hypothetical protein
VAGRVAVVKAGEAGSGEWLGLFIRAFCQIPVAKIGRRNSPISENPL